MSEVASYADRGLLWPKRLLETFRRLAPSPRAKELVRWWWVASWRFPSGVSSAQQVLSFPGSNLTFEPGEVNVVGPTTAASTRVLEGHGWVVGALLQPAVVPTLTPHPATTRDQAIPIPAAKALAAVTETVASGGLEAGAVIAEDWLVARVGELSDEMRFANQMMHVLQTTTNIATVPQAASALGVSPRTLQRLTSRYVGLPPSVIIRRRRLQDAAATLRERPRQVADAAVVGYSDQSHLTRDMRTTMGITPGQYQREVHQEPDQ